MIREKTIFDTNPKLDSTRFAYRLFKNLDIQKQIAVRGFSVQPLLTCSDVQQLNADFNEMLKLLPEPLPETHWTSGRVEDIHVRNFARQSIDRIVPIRLEKYFNASTVDFIGGIFLAKKPSPKSELTAHQDSSHTDERTFPAIYAWVALTDTTVENGAMHVLPGSHLWGNCYRSLNVPWLYAGLESELNKYLYPIPMRAGEVLFFDSAAIHYSSNNMGDNVRTAINYFIKPKEAIFLHHYMDEQTPKDKVEVYNVDIDFFYNCDFMKRPEAPYKFLGYETYNLSRPTTNDIQILANCTNGL